MRIPIQCPRCRFESSDTELARVYYLMPLKDNRVYDLTCHAGHREAIFYTNPKFEFLFEVSICALADSYHREAVASSAAAMERFMEFYLRCLATHIGCAPGAIDEPWKRVGKQSERQLGAFVFAYFMQNKRMPALLKEDDNAFRNEVIHKGYFPTETEALDYMGKVLGAIVPTYTEIRETMSTAVGVNSINEYLIEEKKAEGRMRTNVGMATILGRAAHTKSKDPAQIREQVAQLRALKTWQVKTKGT